MTMDSFIDMIISLMCYNVRMRRLRLVIRIATGALIVLTIIGIVILVVNQKLDFLDTSFEIIAFSLGAAGMIMAVVAQIDSYQGEKQLHKIFKEIEELNREYDEDGKVNKKFQGELDAILQFDQKIYRKISKYQKEIRDRKKK
jgi:hypothetical protein